MSFPAGEGDVVANDDGVCGAGQCEPFQGVGGVGVLKVQASVNQFNVCGGGGSGKAEGAGKCESLYVCAGGGSSAPPNLPSSTSPPPLPVERCLF